jgi:hypothetical protein
MRPNLKQVHPMRDQSTSISRRDAARLIGGAAAAGLFPLSMHAAEKGHPFDSAAYHSFDRGKDSCRRLGHVAGL